MSPFFPESTSGSAHLELAGFPSEEDDCELSDAIKLAQIKKRLPETRSIPCGSILVASSQRQDKLNLTDSRAHPFRGGLPGDCFAEG